MLEFEENNQPIEAHVTAPAGFVVIPLEQYNDLLMAAEPSYIPVSVGRPTWPTNSQELEARINPDWLCTTVREMIKYKYGAAVLDEYELKTPDDIYIPTITIAVRKQALQEPEEL